MKKLGSILFLISACTASVDNMGPGGDDDDGDGDGDGDGGPGVGNDDIRFRLTSVHDERADQIDFATGEPVHTHGGPTVQLGGADCPDVYKHAYLMSTTAPQFGREIAPNPVAYKIEASGAAEYRVRAGEATTVLDWTAVGGTAIELHRDVVTGGKYLLDVRVGASVATTCFILHPLAAPLEMQTARPHTTGLPGMSFAATSPISHLINGAAVPVYSQRFAHHTAEPVELAIDVAKPTGTFSRRAVDDHIEVKTFTTSIPCSDANGDTGDPLCQDTTTIPASTAALDSGAISTATWSIQVIDEATNAVASNCTITALRATCKLPARGATDASQRYRVVLAVTNLSDLAPFGIGGGAIAEHNLATVPFTGRILETVQRCAQYKSITKFEVTAVSCIKAMQFTRFQAIDNALLTFDPVAFSLSAAPSATLPLVPLAPQDAPAYIWDSGDADLPGPQ